MGNGNSQELVAGPSESAAAKFAAWLTNAAVNGVGPLASSAQLAEEYRLDRDYADDGERVDSLIKWETAKNFSTGFVTGLGGFITLPVSIPAGLGAAWALQARMVGAIAEIYGHSVTEARTQTAILLCLVGGEVQSVLKGVGVKAGTRLTQNLVAKIPGRVLTEINKKIGFRLLTKAGEKGLINLSKLVPFVGGPISGTIDAVMCRAVGKAAKQAFRPARKTQA